jgi:transposase
MPRPRKYDDELKERAVRLTLESGRPIAHVAADLGIGAESLRGWVRQAEADAAGGTPSMLTTAERERLNALERENRELKKADEMLKAASVFFAKELDGAPRR